MLSGESNENGEKTIIGLISKKQLSTCSTPFFFFYTFLCHCFARFLEKMSHLLISSCSLVFSLSLIFTIFSTPLRNFHVGLPKNDSLPPSLAFCRSFFFFLMSFAGLSPTSLYLCPSFSLFQICGHDN